MATKIVTKNSSTASAAPTASDLVQGELAVNVTDKRLYTENNSGAIVELGTNPAGAVTMASTLAVTGNVDFNGDLDVDGTTNLDVVDIDGAVDMASTLTVAGVLTGASLDISGNIDVDGTTNLDVVDIDGAVDMASTLAVGGVLTANAGVVVDNFTLNGTTLALSSGDMTLDSASSINLNADNGNIVFQDGAVTTAMFQQTSSNFIIRSLVSDKDIIFQGEDGAASVVALTLDMSDAGNAFFNNHVNVSDSKAFISGTNSDFQMYHLSGANVLHTTVSDADMTFKGNDGGSVITALTLDMSAAGAATFNSNVISGGGLFALNGDGTYAKGLTIAKSGEQQHYIYSNGATQTNAIGSSAANWVWKQEGGANKMTLSAAGAATFSSSVTSTGVYLNNASNGFLWNTANGGIQFGTNNTERMRIDSSGNVLVASNGATPSSSQAGISLGLSGPNGGKILIANTLTSTFAGAMVFVNGNGQVGSIATSGSATSYNTSSDYRLKENVVPMTGSIDRVKALKPSRFNFIVDSDTTVDGFLAHEAQAVVPECATGTKDAMVDEEYEVTAAVYEDVTTPAVEAVEGVKAIEAVEAVDAVYDDEGVIVSEAVEAVEAVEGVEAVEAVAETTESVLVTEAVMGTRSVPDMQGIDQAKLVPLLTAALQEAITKIESLEARLSALEE